MNIRLLPFIFAIGINSHSAELEMSRRQLLVGSGSVAAATMLPKNFGYPKEILDRVTSLSKDPFLLSFVDANRTGVAFDYERTLYKYKNYFLSHPNEAEQISKQSGLLYLKDPVSVASRVMSDRDMTIWVSQTIARAEQRIAERTGIPLEVVQVESDALRNPFRFFVTKYYHVHEGVHPLIDTIPHKPPGLGREFLMEFANSVKSDIPALADYIPRVMKKYAAYPVAPEWMREYASLELPEIIEAEEIATSQTAEPFSFGRGGAGIGQFIQRARNFFDKASEHCQKLLSWADNQDPAAQDALPPNTASAGEISDH